MVLIISLSGDYSTDRVIEWLNYFEHKHIRINPVDLLESNSRIFINVNKRIVKFGTCELDLNCINSVWVRKSDSIKSLSSYEKLMNTLEKDVLKHLNLEFHVFLRYLFTIFESKYTITNPFNQQVNKLETLEIASKIGLKVPQTYLLNNKENLIELLRKKDFDFIVKAMHEPSLISAASANFSLFTETIEVSDLQYLPEKFFISLVQQKIEKDFEIRVFVLDNEVYPMAIFSQQDSQTRIDFRRYNWAKPNRVCGFMLPEIIEKKYLNLHLSYH